MNKAKEINLGDLVELNEFKKMLQIIEYRIFNLLSYIRRETKNGNEIPPHILQRLKDRQEERNELYNEILTIKQKNSNQNKDEQRAY